MKDINNCPSTLVPGNTSYSYSAIRKVFDNKTVSHILSRDFFKILKEGNCDIVKKGGQMTVGASIEKGKMLPTKEGITGKYIIKFAPRRLSFSNLHQIPANEHLTMQIAKQVYKINTAENALIFLPGGNPAYLCKRFDLLKDGNKIKQVDFASLTGKSADTHGKSYKYIGSYAGLGMLIKTYCAAWQVEMCKYYKLVVFNYIFGNGDAHLKDFSIMQTIAGDYILTPAYGLVNTLIHNNLGVFALDDGLFQKIFYSKQYKRRGYPCVEDFITFGKMLDIPDSMISRINNEFLQLNDKVYELISRSFLEKNMKKKYLEVYEQRTKRFFSEG